MRNSDQPLPAGTAKQVIDLLGGLSAVARETGWPVSTVHSWMRNGNIPHWRRERLADLARTRQLDLPHGFLAEITGKENAA